MAKKRSFDESFPLRIFSQSSRQYSYNLEWAIETAAIYIQAFFAWKRPVQHAEQNQKGSDAAEDETAFYAEISLST
jgi:hypothetical protein